MEMRYVVLMKIIWFSCLVHNNMSFNDESALSIFLSFGLGGVCLPLTKYRGNLKGSENPKMQLHPF